MLDFLSGALVFILRLVDFVLEIARWVTNMQIIARQLTGSDKLVDVPPEPKGVASCGTAFARRG
jgi:hypothetical protein